MAAPPAESRHGSGRLRVLVVEDHRESAQTLQMLLGLFGHEAAVAHTGPEGLRAARAWCPDVVLCDIGLPGLDGWGVARALRADPVTAEVHLIAVTGYGEDDDRQRSHECGFDLHLVKPVDPADLAGLLSRLK
jgi:CheY-like chemotaxis protein